VDAINSAVQVCCALPCPLMARFSGHGVQTAMANSLTCLPTRCAPFSCVWRENRSLPRRAGECNGDTPSRVGHAAVLLPAVALMCHCRFEVNIATVRATILAQAFGPVFAEVHKCQRFRISLLKKSEQWPAC